MAAEASTPILRAIDEAPITSRYWNVAALILTATAVEFFDFFIIGFIASIIGPEWNLTFGSVATIFYAAGVGAIVGSFLGGWLGHNFGRRMPFIVGLLVSTLSAGAIALAPVGAVWYVFLMRLLVGAGLGIMVTMALTTIVELTPTRHRTILAGFATTGIIPLAILLAAILSATLAPVIGWRGLAVISGIPALMAVWAAFVLPESPRWLISQGRTAEARRVVAWLLKRPEESMSLDVASDRQAPETVQPSEPASYIALYRYPKSFWFTILAWLGATTAAYGFILWGPTIFHLVLDITPAKAATYFIYVTLGGFAGRILFSLLANWIGRRATGLLMGFGGAAFLIVAAFTGSVFIGGVSLLVITFVLADIFLDGGFVNLAPTSSEVFPTRLRAHGTGLSQVVSGVGKILGPLGLAVVAGTSNIVNPEATREAITPGLIFLAAFSVLAALGFLLFPETRGRTLEDMEEEVEAQRRPLPRLARLSGQ